MKTANLNMYVLLLTLAFFVMQAFADTIEITSDYSIPATQLPNCIQKHLDLSARKSFLSVKSVGHVLISACAEENYIIAEDFLEGLRKMQKESKLPDLSALLGHYTQKVNELITITNFTQDHWHSLLEHNIENIQDAFEEEYFSLQKTLSSEWIDTLGLFADTLDCSACMHYYLRSFGRHLHELDSDSKNNSLNFDKALSRMNFNSIKDMKKYCENAHATARSIFSEIRTLVHKYIDMEESGNFMNCYPDADKTEKVHFIVQEITSSLDNYLQKYNSFEEYVEFLRLSEVKLRMLTDGCYFTANGRSKVTFRNGKVFSKGTAFHGFKKEFLEHEAHSIFFLVILILSVFHAYAINA